MRSTGMDVHRSFAQVAIFGDGQITQSFRIDMEHDAVVSFGRSLEQKSANLNHLTLPEIKDFNALSDALCCRLNGFRSNPAPSYQRCTLPMGAPRLCGDEDAQAGIAGRCAQGTWKSRTRSGLLDQGTAAPRNGTGRKR